MITLIFPMLASKECGRSTGAFHGPMLVGLALTVLVAVAPHALAVLVGA